MTNLARCASCGAYVNHLCKFLRRDWRCSLCSKLTPLTERYKSGVRNRREYTELVQPAFDVSAEEEEAEQMAALPVCVALVDVSADDNYLEVVRSALHAAIAAHVGLHRER